MTDELKTYIQLNDAWLGLGYVEDYIQKANNIKTVHFTFQEGPIKENGVNGVQYDILINVAKCIIEKLNKAHPCRQNLHAIAHLEEALTWLEKRTQDRIARDVEGTDND
jgi:hypothetical protein